MHEKNISVMAITSLFYPYYGGAEKQLERLSEKLRLRGVNISILTRRLANLKNNEALHNVPIYRVSTVPSGSRFLQALSFVVFSCIFFVVNINITRKVSILQADCDSPGLIAIIVGKLFKKKVVIRMRGAREIESIKNSLLAKTYFRIISRSSNAIIMQYNQLHELESLGIDSHKIRKIRNGVDIEYFKRLDSKDRTALREKMGFGNSIIGIYVGRLDPAKGVDTLIKILHSTIHEHPEFKLIIVGSGPSEHYLKALASNLNVDANIVFAGAKKNVKIYYGISDIFFLLSKSEGISNALLEAMSMSLSVLVSNSGGSVEIIDHEKNGLLVDPNSVSCVLEHSRNLLNDDMLRTKLGTYARKTIERTFSIDQAASSYICLYSNLIQN